MSDAGSNVTGRQAAVVMVLVAMLAGGYFAVRTFLQSPTKPNLGEGQVVVEFFLTNIVNGKAGEAWDASTVEFKSIEGRESFIRKTKTVNVLQEPLQFASTQEVKLYETPRTEFLYTSPKTGVTIRVLVGYEGGKWKVDRLTF